MTQELKEKQEIVLKVTRTVTSDHIRQPNVYEVTNNDKIILQTTNPVYALQAFLNRCD
jgi:hypothetical protein